MARYEIVKRKKVTRVMSRIDGRIQRRRKYTTNEFHRLAEEGWRVKDDSVALALDVAPAPLGLAVHEEAREVVYNFL